MTKLASTLRAAVLFAAITGSLALAFGQGEAAAQADAAGEVRALRAEVERISARVAALDAIISKQGQTITVTGERSSDEVILRANANSRSNLSVSRADAVLRFDRITLIGKEIALSAHQKMSLKAPTISLDGEVVAKGSNDLTIKGSKIGGN
jgi:outer membrane murein-binding lipoprotein Lpp